jgi:thiamine pyrophosphate-dependent acetolactate synthase large subunit-like protein
MGQDRQDPKINSRLWNLAGLGTEFAIIVLGCIYSGSWLDSHFPSLSPWGILLGVFGSMAIGIPYLIYRTKV